MTIKHIGGSERFSAIVIHGNVAYLAGQVSQKKEAGIAEQTQDVFDKIDALLEQAGSSRASMLSVQIWLKNMADYDGMNAVWDAWLKDCKSPTRVCVEAAMAQNHYLVEVMVIAAANR